MIAIWSWGRLAAWGRRVHLRHHLVVALVIASMASGIATYAAMTHSTIFGDDPTSVTILSLLDLGFLVLLGTLVTQRLLAIWMRRRRNQAGSRLQARMISVFALLAAAPALLVAMFAGIFFYFGVETWFSSHVKTSLDESLTVAQAYLEEHKQVLRADALAMANDLNRQAPILASDPDRLTQAVEAQSYLRNLTEVMIFDGNGKILARSGLTFALTFEPVTDEMKREAQRGDVVLRISESGDRVRAMVRLDNFIDSYLFVGRPVEPKVLAHMAATQAAVSEYRQLENKRSGLQIIIALIFVVVAMLLLLGAVWFGINFATRLVRPISDLMNATDRVRGGDLSARVDESSTPSDDELDLLGRAFNRMTAQLQNQREELVDANAQLDFRRRFTETVLAGVSAGVIGLDAEGRITLMNASAAEFFNIDDVASIQNQSLATLSTDLLHIVETMPHSVRFRDGQVEIRRAGLPTRTLLVRVTSEIKDMAVTGYVLTFDDVSDLLSAQRKAAWADIARRIAHEIKNPLTPIQLSAERLRRKYAKEVVTDPEVFITCTDTIIRHVDDIGRMVDEFSAFARMPAPTIKPHDLRDICRQVLFLQSGGRGDITYDIELPEQPCIVECDARQIAQALTNLLKNAAEAIDGRVAPLEGTLSAGHVHLVLACDEDQATIRVEDNGKGLPVEERERLTEPYVTTRQKGTGLGLAIVKKIMEDHLGTLSLSDRGSGHDGAVVTLNWPKQHERATIDGQTSPARVA